MNGALTIGTRDGATHRDGGRRGEENLLPFRLTTEQVPPAAAGTNPQWHYENEPENKGVPWISSSPITHRNEPGAFNPLREVLLTRVIFYMHLADMTSYLDADRRLTEYTATRTRGQKRPFSTSQAPENSQAPAPSPELRCRHLENRSISSVLAQLAKRNHP
jgi:starch phosphorylase